MAIKIANALVALSPDHFGPVIRFATPEKRPIAFIELTDHNEGDAWPDETLATIEPELVQSILDGLWRQGYRPSGWNAKVEVSIGSADS